MGGNLNESKGKMVCSKVNKKGGGSFSTGGEIRDTFLESESIIIELRYTVG